jgi:hypothetical protein
MSETLRPEDFLPHLRKTFHFRGHRHALVLSAVERGGPGDRGGFREPFLLIFSGPPGDVLPEGMYVLEAEGSPAFELYVMPIHTPARDRQDYQSSFS